MIYKFIACGHPNILASHKTTLEFIKDPELSLNGNCIVGIGADFDFNSLKEFVKKLGEARLAIMIKTLSGEKIVEKITSDINMAFNDPNEIVVRKTNFISGRTLGINSDKAASDLNRRLINYLKKRENKVAVILKMVQ